MIELESRGQGHVLAYYNELNDTEKAHLDSQLAELDWNLLDGLIDKYVLNSPDFSLPQNIGPAPYFAFDVQDKEFYDKAYDTGIELIKSGKLGCFIVAGGQGSRLGFDGPKGTYPVSPIEDKTLFQLFAERIGRYNELYQTNIPLYVMTSQANNEDTVSFFEANDYFNLSKEDVIFFKQGRMPAFDFEGKLILSDKSSLFMSPDGHGGSLRALHNSGALADMAERGIDYISYFQVDNPLADMVDPTFLGLHVLEESEMSNRMFAKRDASEKLGVFCEVDGKIQVIEYSDLPEELSKEVDANGKLRFLAGSPAIHLITRSFVEELNADGFSLPFHRAIKKVPYLNADGEQVKPDEANGVKLETFVFDALPLAKKSMVYEALRERQFAAVKNPDGNDSPISCREIMQEEFARWLKLANIDVPRDADGKLACTLEISYAKYANAEDFASVSHEIEINAGDKVYIG